MCSDVTNSKFCFINLENLDSIGEDSIFFNIQKIIKITSNINDENCIKLNTDDNENLCKKNYTIIIAFARMKDLHNPETYEKLAKSKLRDIYEKQKDFSYNPCPMIVIGLEELPGVLEEKIRQKRNNDLKNQFKVVESLNLDARVNFFDSSIWHCYVPLNESFLEKFQMAINEIEDNIKLNLYRTNVAKEFLEFQTRLLKNSYLANLGGAHATKVTPFQFHSATEMSLKADRIIEDTFKDKDIFSFKWRLLLVDDYAHTGLRCTPKKGALTEPYGEGTGPSKIKIITRILGIAEEINADNWIQIRYVGDINKSYLAGFKKIFSKDSENVEKSEQQNYEITIDDNIKKLKAQPGQIYDIILIDYLLAGDNKNEYCTNLLQWIKEQRYDDKLKGPLGRFWFFPISVFSYALHEEIREKGWKHLEEEWHLATGADLVNTPQLFRYSLFKFMEMQVKEARSFKKIGDLIKKLFTDSTSCFNDENSKYLQRLAKQNYHIFLKDMNSFENLLSDKKNKSLFAVSFFEKYKDIDNSLWEHLHHLIFMLGHEPAKEWPKMWDEYNIIADKIIESGDLSEGSKRYLEAIKKYIIDLQKQAR